MQIFKHVAFDQSRLIIQRFFLFRVVTTVPFPYGKRTTVTMLNKNVLWEENDGDHAELKKRRGKKTTVTTLNKKGVRKKQWWPRWIKKSSWEKNDGDHAE